MRRESPYPMLPIAEAQALIAAHTPLLPLEPCYSAEADGRVLAEDIWATAAIPDLPKATVDGYALRGDDGLAPRRVLGELTAGNAQVLTVEPGSAARIMTGAPLPPGADAVIMVEDTEEQDGVLTVRRALKPGDYVLPPGSDLAEGQLVLRRGTLLGPAEIGLLMTVGRPRVSVYRQPVVAVLSTGDEVYEPDAPLPPGGVRDANRYALIAAARAAGCRALSLGIGHDEQEPLRERIEQGFAKADVLLTSGGVSMGTRDLVKPLLAELGTLHFGRVFFKPGKPTSFATLGGKLAFGLPGNPASALVSFEVFVRPALRRMQGDERPERPLVPVTLAEPIRPSDRPEYQRVTIAWQGAGLVAHSTGSQSSSRLLSLHGANGLLIVPPGAEILPAGTRLEALLTDRL
jgi:molybdenum cofactor synthesis domain-containing protein